MDLGMCGRAYVVFGGTRGIGLAAARALTAEGAHVALVGRDRTLASDVAGGMDESSTGKVVGIAGDINEEGEAERLLAEASQQLGPLRGLVVTTGLGMRAQRDVLTATDADWAHSFSDILMGTVHVCRAGVPLLVEAGGGAIVTTAAYSIRSPKPHQAPYAALKSSVATLTKGIAKAFGSQDIRANCVCPGATETEVLAAMRTRIARERGWPVEGALERIMAQEWGMNVALGRAAKANEVGDVIAFLLSERASYVT
ncbi:MAG TPA: SDR family oxidoreductase, partial [Tepidiformaceae bacterium]